MELRSGWPLDLGVNVVECGCGLSFETSWIKRQGYGTGPDDGQYAFDGLDTAIKKCNGIAAFANAALDTNKRCELPDSPDCNE